MKLDIIFGPNKAKRVDWDQSLESFPKLLKYQGKKWEWAMYKVTPYVDYELVFSELPTYDPNFYISDYGVFEDMFEKGSNDCQCGAQYSSFSWDHMRFCPKWVPWK